MTDLDETIARIPRGERGELRIARRTYRGSAPFVDVRHYYPDDATGELRPGRGATIREHELRDVANALLKVIGHGRPEQGRARRRAQGEISYEAPAPARPKTEAELREVDEAF